MNICSKKSTTMPRSIQTTNKSGKSSARKGKRKSKDKPTKTIKKTRVTEKSKAKKKASAPVSASVERTRTPRRRAPGERAAQEMIELQMKNAKYGQKIENKAKFNRGMYNCFRNMVPNGQIGSDAAALVYEDVNKYGSALVSSALEFAMDRKQKRITSADLISALSLDKALLAGITPHTPSTAVTV